MSDYETQVQLEERMRGMTVERFHRLHKNAAERGDFSETNTGKALQDHLEFAMRDALQAFVDKAKSGAAGRRHAAVKMIDDLNVDTVAFLTTKAVINGVPMYTRASGQANGAKCTVQRIAFLIAGMCHDEVALRYFEQNQRRLLRSLIKTFDQRDLPRRRRKELIQRSFTKLGLDWRAEGWGDQNRLHFGVRMLELFKEATGTLQFVDLQAGTKHQRKYVVPTPELNEAIERRMEANEALYSVYLPTVIPPRPWTQDRLFGGGYYTKNVRPYPLVKDSNRAYIEELENSDIQPVLDAVNALQDTPWRVSKFMAEVTRWAYENHGDRCGMPPANPRTIPPKPPEADTDEEASREYRKVCYQTHDANRKDVSRRIHTHQALNLADMMAEYETIYFPHYLDSRGRAYPKPVVLNPQGPDFVKGMLEFAEGRAVEFGSEAHAWLMVSAANSWGEDKLELQGRVDWAVENEELILSCGEDPKSDLRWMEADEPFQFLHICRELYCLALAESEGRVFLSHIPVNVDATCSGIQHFSAMLRDEVGGTSVNLRALPERKDVYQEVADRAAERIKRDLEDADSEVRAKAQAALDAGVTRKLTKRSVMIVPYSGTFHSAMAYIDEHYAEQGQKPWDPMGQFVPYVTKHVWSAIAEVVVAARGAMDWLTQITKLACEADDPLPMVWTTPDGFPVRQVRYESMPVRVETILDGKRVRLSYTKDGRNFDKARMKSSVAPNFVHSMDAAHMRLTISACLEAYASGSIDRPMRFSMIHDSFGVHAADMPAFTGILREAFVDMYEEHDVLAEFVESVKPILDNPEAAPEPPRRGTLDLSEVLESEFFFS